MLSIQPELTRWHKLNSISQKTSFQSYWHEKFKHLNKCHFLKMIDPLLPMFIFNG